MKPFVWSLSFFALCQVSLAQSPVCPLTAVEETKLDPVNGASLEFYGESVAISADTAVIGARGDDDLGTNAGAAYVYVRSGSKWKRQAKLFASDGAQSDGFGNVTICGHTIVVGAPGDDDNGSNSGSAYVFVRTGTTWTEQAKLLASDGESFDFFGAVSVSNDTVVVGASGEDDNGPGAGAAYVFVRNGTTWSEEAKLLASNGAAGDELGICSLFADTVVIGARGADPNGLASGAAWVFVRTGTSWSEQAQLAPSEGKTNDQFGFSVSLSGDTAVIGAPQDDGKALNAGSAYVFERTGTTWTEHTELFASDAAANDHFGAVSVSGAVVAIGAPHDDTKGTESGASYVFRRNGTSWSEEAKLLASDGSADDWFGAFVALSGDTIVTGAPFAGPSPNSVGAAYIHKLLAGSVVYCTAKAGLACGTPSIAATGIPSASATSGFTISAAPAGSNRMGILLYTSSGRANVPFPSSGHILCVQAPLKRGGPANSGGTPGGCDGVFALDMNQYASGNYNPGFPTHNPATFLLTPGQQVNCQWWGRDSVATGSFMSDAIEYLVCP